MTCQSCQQDGFEMTQCQVCWCHIDLCAGCVELHIASCQWAKAMKYKPQPKKKKAEPFPKIGHQSKHLNRRSQTA